MRDICHKSCNGYGAKSLCMQSGKDRGMDEVFAEQPTATGDTEN